jgi:DNA polymerase-3 subunit epsilon
MLISLILGTIFEKQDEAKEEKRQQDITSMARSNMLYHNYLEKHEKKCGWRRVKLTDYRFAFVNDNGQYLNDAIFVSAEDFSHDAAAVRIMDGGAAIIHSSGRYILPPEERTNLSTYIEKVYDGVFKYKKTFYSKPSYVDHTEIYLIKSDGCYINKEYATEVLDVKENYVKLKFGQKIAEMSFDGGFISKPFVKKVELGDGLFRVCDHDNVSWGIYDEKNDRIIIPCKYSGILYSKLFNIFILKPFGDGHNALPAFAVDRNGCTIIPPKYDRISILNNKYLQVSYYNKERGCGLLSGIIDINGNIIVQPIYGYIWPTGKNFMVAEYDGKKRCGLVKTRGYSDLEYDSYEEVFLEGQYSISTTIAEFVSDGCKDLAYSESKSLMPKYLIVSKGSKFGVINLDNEILIPIKYDQINAYVESGSNKTAFIVKLAENYYLLNENGVPIVRGEFSNIEWKIDGHFYSRGFNSEIEDMEEWKSFLHSHNQYFRLSAENCSTYVDFEGKPYELNKEEVKISRKIIPTTTETDLGGLNSKTPTHTQYLFFDTETTGLPRNYQAPSTELKNWPRMVQISWIVSDNNGKILKERDHIIKPSGFIIPSDASKIHGITNEVANQKGEPIEDVLTLFIKDFKNASIIVGHNISFDKKIVGAELIRCGESDIMDQKPSICTMNSTINFCKIEGIYGDYKYPKLQELYFKLFDENFDDAHNSASDISATFKCFWELKRRGIIGQTE